MGCDVTAYSMLGGTETHAVVSSCNIFAGVQKDAIKKKGWRAVESHFNVMSIFKMG